MRGMTADRPMIDLKEVAFLRGQGVSLDAIAEQLGVELNSIMQAQRRARGRGICSVCGVEAAITLDGVITVHGWVVGAAGNCAGSHSPPVDDVTITMPVPQPRPSHHDETHWGERAACASHEPEMFFDPDPTEAKKVCAGCPVAHECLEYATDIVALFGTWGGLSEAERASLKLRRRGRRR